MQNYQHQFTFEQLSNKPVTKIMQRQSHDHQNQSDNDEGFIPSKLIVKQKKQMAIKKQTKSNQKKMQFIGRYISEGIMRKQPSECYKRFSKFDCVQQQSGNSAFWVQNSPNLLTQNQQDIQAQNADKRESVVKNKNKQKTSTPYDKYTVSGQYNLVYSRYKDFKFSNDDINFATNQVKLDCLRSMQQMKFKPIKPFQIIEQKSQQVLTHNSSKSASIRQSLLQFDSKFQSGNLLCAFKHRKQAYTYTLFIQNDTNTYGYNQWFYFSVRNARTRIKYKFNIVNFRKRHSFFREGNRLVVFSLVQSKKEGLSGYSKRGQNVNYGRSPIVKSYDSKQKFFQLSFQLSFTNQNDTCYISAGLPYSYSKLLLNLRTYQQIAKQKNIKYQLQSIGTSIAGNRIPYLTITKTQDSSHPCCKKTIKINNSNSQQSTQLQSPCGGYRQQSQQPQPQQRQKQGQSRRQNRTESQYQQNKKRVILVIARQHPGETWSSYLMDEFIYNLVSQKTVESTYLLNNFTIKCIPMINVDGVINGNFRCDLSGMDLNRTWKYPSTLLHPQIYSIKNQIISLTNRGAKIQICLDLHGHSKQYNLFCYSCNTDNYECRLLPYIFSEYNQEFHFPFCTFGISKYKQQTARAVIFDIIKNTNVLTIQSSFFGSDVNGEFKLFEPKTFEKMAQTLIKGSKSYCSQDRHYQACKQIVRLRMSQFLQCKGQQSNILSGSDSEPSGDQIQLAQKLKRIIPKNLIEECISMEIVKKPQKKLKKNLKRRSFQVNQDKKGYQVKQLTFNSIKKNSTIDVTKDLSRGKQVKSNWSTINSKNSTPCQKNVNSHFKRQSFILSNEKNNQSELLGNQNLFIKDIIDKQQVKLPFFLREKSQMKPIKLRNQSFEVSKDTYNATQKCIKHGNQTCLSDMVNSRRNVSKKLGIFKQKETDQFPLLCVLSENQKKTHAEKHRQRKEAVSVSNKAGSMPQKAKAFIQTRTQTIEHLRYKNKNSFQLVSKIWRQNFTRYGMAFSTFKIGK